MATKKSSQAKKVESDHAKTGKPVSPTEDPTDHSVPAAELAAQIDPAGKSGATVNAKSMDAVSKADKAKEDAAKLEEDKTIVGKIRKSGLYWIQNHASGDRYVGISPQNDPDATKADKRLSTVMPLDSVSPRTGMVIRPKDGAEFNVGDGFGPETNPGDWAKVQSPEGKPLFD